MPSPPIWALICSRSRNPVDGGRSGGARTPNPRFWRPVLYQLSYTPNLLTSCPGSTRASQHLRRDPRIKSGDDGRKRPSLYDLGDDAGADGATAFADRKAQPLIHRDRGDQFDLHRDVVPRHHHLGAFGEVHGARHVGRAEVELRSIVAEKRRVPAALLLGQDVGLALEAGLRRDRARRRQHLAALDLLAFGAAQQRPDVVAGLAL